LRRPQRDSLPLLSGAKPFLYYFRDSHSIKEAMNWHGNIFCLYTNDPERFNAIRGMN
jgi:hypothetical protein